MLCKKHWCRGPESNRYGSHLPQDFKSCASASSATPAYLSYIIVIMDVIIGGGNRIRTGGKGFADLCLTTWLCRQNLERKTGFEPATPTLARLYSTTELLPQMAGLAGFEPTHDGVKVRCLTAWL